MKVLAMVLCLLITACATPMQESKPPPPPSPDQSCITIQDKSFDSLFAIGTCYKRVWLGINTLRIKGYLDKEAYQQAEDASIAFCLTFKEAEGLLEDFSKLKDLETSAKMADKISELCRRLTNLSEILAQGSEKKEL